MISPKEGMSKMRKRNITGLVLAAAFVGSLITVVPALALESVWLVDSVNPTSQQEVDSESTATGFSFADMKGGIFGEETELLCFGTGLGTVGPGKEDRIQSITTTSCETMKGICGEPRVEAVNLPWLTSVELIGASFYDDLVSTISGKMVGYSVICNKLVEDKCEAALERVLLENGSGGTVNAVSSSADANQPKENCSRGGEGAGILNGTNIVLSVGGLTIAVSEG